MEGEGVKRIMKDLKECHFVVFRVVHDKDSSCMKQIFDVFEDVLGEIVIEEQFCVG